jgi:voltage-gated potassium channel
VTAPEAMPKRGQPRSPADAAALGRFDQRMALPLVLAAVLPLFLLPGGAHPWATGTIFIASWLVFLLDLIVHERRRVHYLSTWLGRFDLFVVIFTAPWFLVVGTGTGKFVVLIRLARVARLVMATRGARLLLQRLGVVSLVALGVVFVGAAVGYRAEHATNPGFKTFGDALWWAVVTLTTVGYGDIVPKTTTGRVDGVMIMVVGIGILGVLAGSLANFFRLDRRGQPAPATVASTAAPAGDDAVAAELAALRAQVARLADELGGRRDSTEPA